MFRPTFNWLIAAAAVTGAALGFSSGREKGAAQSVAPSPTAQTHVESNAPAQTEHEAAPQPAIAEKKDLAAICRMRSESRREAALLAFADSLDATSVQTAIDEAQSLSAEDREQVLATLFARWAELAPEAAASRAFVVNGKLNGMLRAVAAEWAARDPAALWQWAQAQPKDLVQFSDVLGEIAAHDAPTAWRWVQKLERGALGPTDLWGGELFEKWGRQDGAEAFRVAQNLPDDFSRSALGSVLQGWAISNPEAALVAARGIDGRQVRTNALAKVFQTWARRDAQAAMEALLAEPSRGARSDCFEDVLSAFAKRDPQALPALAERLAPGYEKNRVLQRSATHLASADPAIAFATAQSITSDSARAEALRQVVIRVGASRIAELRELAATLPTLEDREAAQTAIHQVWAEADPVAAANSALGMENRETRQKLLETTVRKWPDRRAALHWAQAISDGSDRAAALHGLLRNWAETDPQQAAAHLDRLDEDNGAIVAANIARNWMERDPEAASAWALGLRGSAFAGPVMAEIVEARWPFGTAETATWIETLPPGDLRDAAVSRFCYCTQQADPSTALAWALTIGASDERRNRIEQAVSVWRENDPDAARRWIEETDAISPETKEELRR